MIINHHLINGSRLLVSLVYTERIVVYPVIKDTCGNLDLLLCLTDVVTQCVDVVECMRDQII
ncbi:hypothetical protein SDC9_81882 [bioreactor metagenome]|uniref:Uncharacterized protein n=1 Tax=bioreactor metagenome TaxID=1076179 RepID=A0A644Z3D2_9ZZZZ